MLVLIWAALIFQVRSNDTATNTDLSDKPSLMVPALIEGLKSTLTCTAPSHCSESPSVFTWRWRGAGDNNSASINDTRNEGKNSAWTFIPSSKHHRGEVTCVVNCTGHNTTETSATLNVTYVMKPEISGETTVTEGGVLNLTCTVDSFPPYVIMWTKQNQSEKTNLCEDTGTSTLLISNVTAGHSGQYFCTAKQLNNLTQDVNITVTYRGRFAITGDRAVTEGGVLNLTCSVESSPPSVIIWTKLGCNTSLINGTGAATLVIFNVTADQTGWYICTARHQNNTLNETVNVTVKDESVKEPRITGRTTIKEGDALNLTCTAGKGALFLITWSNVSTKLPELHKANGSATLFIPNVTAEHGGQYICTATHLNTTVSACVNVTVNLRPKIQPASVCKAQSDVLTCVCISEGFPIPTINWPLLENHTEYSITTAVSKNTVNSSVILTVKNHSAVECVSRNENGEVKANLKINKAEDKVEEENNKVFSRLEMIIAFLIGTLLSAIIFCLARICCCRKKQRTYGNLALEMVMSQEDPLMDGDVIEAREDGEAEDQETAEREGADMTDVEYSKINFSKMKRKNPTEAGTSQVTTETEYAEIKKGEACVAADGEGREDEEGMRQCDTEEEEEEDAALYSSVSDILDQM